MLVDPVINKKRNKGNIENMFCIAALIVLAILSVFSAKYRPLTREAFDCVFRRVTFRPCNTGFDIKLQSTILAKLILVSPKFAKFVKQRFDVIALVFVALFIASFVYTIRGIFLFYTTGSCNGLNSSSFCAFDPVGKNNANSEVGASCKAATAPKRKVSMKGINFDWLKPADINVFGCYACKYTRAAYPIINKLAQEYGKSINYILYPTHGESEAVEPLDYCIQQLAPEKYTQFVNAMYQLPIEEIPDASKSAIVQSLVGNETQLQSCLVDPKTKAETVRRRAKIDETGIYGTPTIFIGDKSVVGPKPERVYRWILGWLHK